MELHPQNDEASNPIEIPTERYISPKNVNKLLMN